MILAAETQGEGSAATAAGVVRACGKVCDQIVPLIGEAGAGALFTRSLALTSGPFPFLADARSPGPGRPGEALRSRAAAQEAATAAEAAVALLGAFIGLLARFIGEDLTARLVRAAWPAIFPNPGQETL